jgi:ABC-2 type transport system permease protein
MIAGALFYYQFNSWRNRLQMRIRRLKQPKYLAGAIVGGLYFYFYFFRGLMFGRRTPQTVHAVPPDVHGFPETVAAFALMAVMILAWVLPHSRAALAFTEAEIAFLFPAPMSRRRLIDFKLLKSQTAILVSSLFMTLIGRRWGGGHLLIRALGWWAGMSVFNLHLLGSSFAVTMLMDKGVSNWKRRVVVLGAVVATAATIIIWTYRSLPPAPEVVTQNGYATITRYVSQAFGSGPLPYLLVPFRLIVAPYFAQTYTQFLVALAPVILVMALHYLWVVHSNVAFEEASVDFSRRIAERLAAARSGNLQGRRPKKAARPPFVLRPTGHPAMGLFWKNLISAGQYITARFWMMLVWIVIVAGVMLQGPIGEGGKIGTMMLFIIGMLLAMSLFSGAQMLRNDLRQDLPVADVLKMFPMPGWQVVLGEILAPAVILAGFQWLLILVAVFMGHLEFPGRLNGVVVPLEWRLTVGVSAGVVLPLIDLFALLIPNASALFFPAWFHLGKDAPRGFETMGQQLILMFGQVLALALGLAPAAGVFTLFLVGGSYIHWPMFSVLMGALAAAIILAGEIGICIKLLGGVFERFDVSGELPV